MGTYKDIGAVGEAVTENGNLLPVTLGELREALGYNRLGVRVLGEIATSLSSEGLGYFPEAVLSEHNTAPRFGDVIRVFRKGTALGDVVNAVLSPTIPGDEQLKEIAGSDSADVLKKIRTLLAE